MVTYTDTYVEMLQEDLQHQYRRLFEVGNDLVQALRASEGKDLEISTMKNFLDSSELTLSDALRTVSVRDIEIERLTFALKNKENELESVRDEHRTQIDELMTELNDVKELYYNRLKIEEQQDEEIERLTRKNKKTFRVAEVVTAQREMLATLDRHDALISKAFGCIDNHSDSIYKQQQSIDNLWLYVQGIAAHINTGSSQENP